MRKKIVVLGGGTGMSFLLKGLKEFPVDITAVVSVCDDGQSTGRLRREFNIPAVGDIRKVLVSLAETDPLVEQLFNFRFQTTSDLNGHAVGNLLLTAMGSMTGNMSDGIEAIGKILNLHGKILPLTEDNVTLVGKMTDGSIIEGEHYITESKRTIEKVYYKEEPVVNYSVLEEIRKADLIVLSMGSIYTSIIPNLLCREIVDLLEKIDTPIMYVCNMMTQPGETDNLKVSDHIRIINQYLGERAIDVVVANSGIIDENKRKKYENLEQKDPVLLDRENIKDVEIISNNYVTVENDYLRHDAVLLSLDIFKYLITKK